MRILRPKRCSKDDELSFENIEKHVWPAVNLNKGTRKQNRQ